MSREGLDINVVSYKYEGMRQKEEVNLVLGDVEVEVGAAELGLDDVVSEPVHGRAVGDVGRVGRSGAPGEEGNKFSKGAGDEGPRVSTPREWTRVIVIAVDGYSNRVDVAKEGVVVPMRFEPFSKLSKLGEWWGKKGVGVLQT